MAAELTPQEKRDFFRLNFSTPLEYKTFVGKNSPAAALKGTSENISQSGILFHTKNNPPQISSLVWLSLDIRTLKICQEIESRALIFNNGLLGRVVRVEEDLQGENTFDVGVCFLTQNQKDSREVKELLSELSK